MRIEGRSIFGYFADRRDAEQAKERLVAAGFNDTQLDSGARIAAMAEEITAP